MMNDDPQQPVTNPASNPQSRPLPPRPRGKVFDVMRPGQAPASATSRPVVMGHRSGAQASQITVSGVGERERPGLLDPHQKVNVPALPAAEHHAPTTMASQRPQPSTPPEPGPAPEPAAPPAAPVDEARPAPATEAVPNPPAPGPESATEPSPSLAPTVPEAPMHDKLTDAALEPDAAPPPPAPEQPLPPAQDPLQDQAPVAPPQLDHQPVVVSHHMREPGSIWKIVGLTLLVLLLLAIVLDILMDAGLIPSGPVPHTGFFG